MIKIHNLSSLMVGLLIDSMSNENITMTCVAVSNLVSKTLLFSLNDKCLQWGNQP